MLEAKEGYCTQCELITYFLPVEEGYECQRCKGINTMQGLKNLSEDPEVMAETVVDLYLPDDLE